MCLERRRTTATVLLALVALVAVLAGCGGSGSDAQTTTAGQAPGGAPLRIAAFVNATGQVLSGEQHAVKVLQAWAHATNAAGGVAGHPVEVLMEDTRGDAPTANAKAAAVAGDDSVVAALMFDSGIEGVIARALTKARVPVIGGMGYLPTIWGALPNWLPLATTFPSVLNAGMVMADQLGSGTVAYAVCAEFAGCAAGAPLAQAAATKLGLRYAGTLKVSSSAPDYTAECLSIKSKGVDYVMVGLPSATAMRFIRACETQGYDGKWGMTDGAIEPAAMSAADPGVPIHVALTGFPWFTDDAPVVAYRKTMQDEGVAEADWGDPHSTAAYAAMELLRTTLDSAGALPGRPTRADVVRAYGAVKDETLGGLLAQPTTFTPDRPEQPVSCYWIGTFEHGRFGGAALAKPTCDPPSLGG